MVHQIPIVRSSKNALTEETRGHPILFYNGLNPVSTRSRGRLHLNAGLIPICHPERTQGAKDLVSAL